MTDSASVSVAPPLLPPLLEVGYNYTWPFRRYGTGIGPRGTHREPPSDVDSALPIFEDKALAPPEGTLARNLTFLRDELNIKKVRIFLLCNCRNYGPRPLGPLASGRFVFQAPPTVDPLFFDHFRAMLRIFKAKGVQMVPSLIDFGAFYKLGEKGGGGRTSIASTQRLRFIETMMIPMLRVSQEKAAEGTIFAWEVINEPMWATRGIPNRPHTDTFFSDRDVPPEVMASFIDDCLKVIKAEGFKSTVGHRRLEDLNDFPTGDLPQFHYYANAGLVAKSVATDDPNPLPTFAELASNPRTANAFIGEISADKEGRGFFDKGAGRPWPELDGRDRVLKDAAFERLKLVARKGYRLAFLWPDRLETSSETGRDELKLTADAVASVRRFTRGRFPNGVP